MVRCGVCCLFVSPYTLVHSYTRNAYAIGEKHMRDTCAYRTTHRHAFHVVVLPTDLVVFIHHVMFEFVEHTSERTNLSEDHYVYFKCLIISFSSVRLLCFFMHSLLFIIVPFHTHILFLHESNMLCTDIILSCLSDIFGLFRMHRKTGTKLFAIYSLHSLRTDCRGVCLLGICLIHSMMGFSVSQKCHK